jgi:hypothetical protein
MFSDTRGSRSFVDKLRRKMQPRVAREAVPAAPEG